MNKPDEIVVFPKKTKLLWFLLLGLGFVAMGVWFLSDSTGIASSYNKGRRLTSLTPQLIQLLGGVTVLFFGACTFFVIQRLVNPRPALIINADGILDNASAVSVGFLKWSEIESMHVYDYYGQTFIGIVPRDFDAVRSRLGWFKKGMASLNSRLTGRSFPIPQNLLPMSAEALLEQMAHFQELNERDVG